MKNRITQTIDRLAPRLRPSRFIAAALAVLAACALLPACNILGPVGYFVHGPSKIEARHTLDEQRPTVVFIDDRASVLPNRIIRREIAQIAQDRLLEEEALVDVISFESALAATGRDSFSRPMSIVEIGQAVDAEVVVYATMDGFALTTDGVTYEPTAAARVKVMDVVSAERTFPNGLQESVPVTVTLAKRQGEAPTTSGERRTAERELAQRLGVTIANLFIDHHPPNDSRVTGTGKK